MPDVGGIVIAIGGGLGVFSFVLLPILLLLWLPLVFIYHTRYSLGAMLLAVLGLGFGVSLVVMEDPVAKLLGVLLVLGVAGTLIAQVLGEFDPLTTTPSTDRPPRS